MAEQDIAYILHTRPYRESSQLVTLFTCYHGLIPAVSRGKVKNNSSRQCFVEVQAAWTGKSALKTLISSEIIDHYLLTGNNLLVGMYLNELLVRLLHEHEPVEDIFNHYKLLIGILAQQADIEPHLRRFEFHLLQVLGYGFSLEYEAESGQPICNKYSYQFFPDAGFVVCHQVDARFTFKGADILSMAQDNFHDRSVRLAAKQLMRLALAPHLGSRPLVSRELFKAADST